MDNTRLLIGWQKPVKPAADKIDDLINGIIFPSRIGWQNPGSEKIKGECRKWIMPEEPQGFMKCKKYDPL